MKRERELIDGLIGGSLTPDQWHELSLLVGSDTISRIQSGNLKLRQHLSEISLESNDALRLEQRVTLLQMPSGFLTILNRWSLPIGIAVFISAVIAVLPMVGNLSIPHLSIQQDALFVSPFQIGIGIGIGICLGVAAWLEWSDKL